MTDITASTRDTALPLTAATFTPFLGQPLAVAVGEISHPLTLMRIAPLPHSAREGGGFRLELSGPLDPWLAQGTYDFSLGEATAPIFIVPLGPAQGHMQYEAIFS